MTTVLDSIIAGVREDLAERVRVRSLASVEADARAQAPARDALAAYRASSEQGRIGAFGGWVRAGGQVLSGLVRRRAAEAALYRSDFVNLKRFTNGEVA